MSEIEPGYHYWARVRGIGEHAKWRPVLFLGVDNVLEIGSEAQINWKAFEFGPRLEPPEEK